MVKYVGPRHSRIDASVSWPNMSSLSTGCYIGQRDLGKIWFDVDCVAFPLDQISIPCVS